MDQFGSVSPFEAMFTIVPVIVALGFIFVVGSLVVRGLRYGAADLESAPARCVAKRTDVWGGSGDSSATTRHHATFEFADGSRKELVLSGREYGLLVEGDAGTLSWRLDVFKGLERTRASLPPQG